MVLFYDADTGKSRDSRFLDDPLSDDPNAPFVAVRALAYAPGGRLLAIAGTNGMVQLRDAVTGRRVRALKGHAGDVRRVAFSGSGTHLATAGADGRCASGTRPPGPAGS